MDTVAASAWMIESFARRDLTLLFWALTLAPAPLWIGMIFFRLKGGGLMSPWVVPPFFGCIMAYLLWLLLQHGVSKPEGLDYTGTKNFFEHPLVFLLIWCAWQSSNLLTGLAMYRDGLRSGFHPRVELLLTWLLGPIGMAIFAVRLLLKR